MIKPCFCKPGIMSQCIALDYGEQQSCECFSKATFSNKCMNRNEYLNNHCWSGKAQSIGLRAAEEEEISLIVMSGETLERRCCLNCTLYTCSTVAQAQHDAQPEGGLTVNDLWDMGTNCIAYLDEKMLKKGRR